MKEVDIVLLCRPRTYVQKHLRSMYQVPRSELVPRAGCTAAGKGFSGKLFRPDGEDDERPVRDEPRDRPCFGGGARGHRVLERHTDTRG